MALENARLYETARNLADRDPLTGFFNHRYLHERLAEEVVRAVAHPAAAERGDARPRRLQARQRHVRPRLRRRRAGPRRGAHPRRRSAPRTCAARYGGDEFALILPETDRARTPRARRRAGSSPRSATSPFAADGRRAVRRSAASIGIATYPRDGRTATELIAAADPGLYDAKDAGRQPRPGAGAGEPGRRGRAAAGRVAAARADAAASRGGGCGAVGGALGQYGSTRTRAADSTGAPPLPPDATGPHPWYQGEHPTTRHCASSRLASICGP